MNQASEVDRKGKHIGNKMGIIYGNYFRRDELIAPICETVRKLNLINPHILEIGANNGIVARVVTETCGFTSNIAILDLNEEGLKDSPETYRRIVADNKSLSIESNRLDLILSRSVTHYEKNSEDNQKVLSEVKRVLKPGSYFVNQAVCFSDDFDIKPLKYLHYIIGKTMFLQNEKEVINTHQLVFGTENVSVSDLSVGSLSGSIEDFYKRYDVDRCSVEKDMECRGMSIPQNWEVPYKIIVCKK